MWNVVKSLFDSRKVNYDQDESYRVSFLRRASHLLFGALDIVCNVVNDFRLVCHFKILAMLYWRCSPVECKFASLSFVRLQVEKRCQEYLKCMLIFFLNYQIDWHILFCRSLSIAFQVVGSDRSTFPHTRWWHMQGKQIHCSLNFSNCF